MRWSVGKGCPLPTEEGAVPPPQKFKKKLVQCVPKIYAFRPKGGASPSGPHKYATDRCAHHTDHNYIGKNRPHLNAVYAILSNNYGPTFIHVIKWA